MFSICIPAYEYNGFGSFLLNRLFESILQQSFTDFEVVVSDQSLNDDVKNVCKNWSDKFEIKYLKNDLNGKSSYNINNAIKNASGKFIKPMWMDDLFLNWRCLENIFENLSENVLWGAVDFIHLDDDKKFSNYMIPAFTKDILKGNNRIGGPSVCFFKNDETLFDENLIWFMDCDFYYRLNQKSPGKFIADKVPGVISSIERKFGSVTQTLINKNIIDAEAAYLLEKFKGF
jgi:glycosyltransferase involved in cell wall biosynthesis